MFLQIINQNFRNCTFFAARNEKSDMQKTTKGSINAHKRLRAWVFILIRHPWKKFGLMFNVVFQIYAKIRLRILFSWWLIDNRKLRKYKKKRKHSSGFNLYANFLQHPLEDWIGERSKITFFKHFDGEGLKISIIRNL